MKPLVLIFLLLSLYTYSQVNLVPNPSFERYTACPSAFLITEVNDWSSYRGTPDYYNSCAEGDLSTPCNLSGCQEPATGDGYIGLSAFHNGSYMDGTPFREFVGSKLVEPLTIGQTYYVSFKASAVFGGYFMNNCFSDKLGIKFSMNQYIYDYNNPQLSATVDNFSHIYSNQIITDTNNWVIVSGSFVADMPYEYVILGNFFDNENVDTTLLDEVASVVKSYYFIDDVCVTADFQGCNFTSGLKENPESDLKIYPNPTAELLYLESQNISLYNEITLFNMLGNVISINISQNNNLIRIDVSDLPFGVYILKMKNESGLIISRKFIIGNQ